MRTILYIGGGPENPPDDDYTYNLDPFYGRGPWRRRAEDAPWPIGPDDVDLIIASHVLEHIPAGRARVAVFNEAYRVLARGGIFSIHVPRFPSDASVSDPTHVSYFVPDSFVYFTHPSVSGPTWQVWELASMQTTDALIHCELRKP